MFKGLVLKATLFAPLGSLVFVCTQLNDYTRTISSIHDEASTPRVSLHGISTTSSSDDSLDVKVSNDDHQTGNSLATIVTEADIAKYTAWETEAREQQTAFCEKLKQPNEKDKMANTIQVKVDTTRYGGTKYLMEIYHKSDIVSRNIRRTGFWDRVKTEDMIRRIKACAASKNIESLSELTFVDVGGNVGWFTLVMASIGLNVITVEPMVPNLQLLRRSLCLPENRDLASRIILHAKGVSNVSSNCTVYSEVTNLGDGTITCGDTPPPIGQFKMVKRGQVPVMPLDDLIFLKAMPGRHVAAVKVDTEGHEALVIEGGRRFFFDSGIALIFTEFNPTWIRSRSGREPLDFIRGFVDGGFIIEREAKDGGAGFIKYTKEEALNMANWPNGTSEIMLEHPVYMGSRASR